MTILAIQRYPYLGMSHHKGFMLNSHLVDDQTHRGQERILFLIKNYYSPANGDDSDVGARGYPNVMDHDLLLLMYLCT